ncbi:MAG: hypothetical protein MMC33_004174 [Icmadophila ericetorum]|nr:hypothetical protein [Icmadophila ericetorum]
MASSEAPSTDIGSFGTYLKSCDRILALLGAGLSAASGLPTFRGAGGLWRSHEATSLATPEAFQRDPALVWQFYSYRRHMAVQAQPNRAHYALAELAKRKENFLTLSQNVDGLSSRAGHPASKLHLLHGSLFDVRCTSFYCNYTEENNFTDPIVPALAIPTEGPQAEPASEDKTGAEATKSLYATLDSVNGSRRRELDISNENVPIAQLDINDLPHCPKCKQGLLRPGVVWFGEALPSHTLATIDRFVAESEKIDLILVIGTSAKVYPAAGYIDVATAKGARVAVVNMDQTDAASCGLEKDDWFFQGDAGVIVPKILESVIGAL